MRSLSLIVVTLAAVSACAADADPTTASKHSDGGREGVETEVLEFLVELGATDDEAHCMASALAVGADSIEAVSDRTATYPSISAALQDLAPGCASDERYEAIGEKFSEAFTPDPNVVQEGRADLFLPQFLDGGATDEEADCMAGVLAALPAEEIPPIYGSYEGSDPALAVFTECGTPERIAQVYTQTYRAPLRVQLVAASATDQEAACIIESIEQIDLFLPSEDFRGENGASITADLFARDAAACAPEDQLRAVASELFRIYEAEN